jgi:hypothetical protein
MPSTSFYDMAVVCYWIARFGDLDDDARPGLRRALGRSDRQLDLLLSEAADLDLITFDSGTWRLSNAGRRIGAAMLEMLAKTRRLAARETYRPFYEYVPRDWPGGIE